MGIFLVPSRPPRLRKSCPGFLLLFFFIGICDHYFIVIIISTVSIFFVELFISTGPLGFCVTGVIGACAGGLWLDCGLYWSLGALPPWGVIAVAAPGPLGTQLPFATWALINRLNSKLIRWLKKVHKTLI